ncbi:MAG: UDP-3-O-(3-hydroxymyristoyl)glucosamine N-acyltransferase [Acidobacteria bacterium]|nr:UDP-3-O-(3-hydroxymyristoyl)glucosamine N-acyltransferase [Acidobacteriota bacterium]
MDKKTFTLTDLARHVNGRVAGNGQVMISGVRPFAEAAAADLTLAADTKYWTRLNETKASAIIVPLAVSLPGLNLLHVQNPKQAFAEILRLFYVPPYQPTGVSPRAFIGVGTHLGRDLSIYPGVCVGRDCRIGDRVTLHPGVVLGDAVQVGEDAVLYANVSVYERVIIGRRVIIHSGTVVGSDGFGFVEAEGRHIKIPQTGTVEIGDDVEIGANCAIDRATLGRTVIGRGAKLDNFVQVGHNTEVGEDCILVAQVGLSGSTTLGRRVTMAGQSATNPHVTIGEGAMIGGQAGVTKNVKPGAVVSGTPAVNHMDWKRAQVLLARLPNIYDRLRALEEQAHRPISAEISQHPRAKSQKREDE